MEVPFRSADGIIVQAPAKVDVDRLKWINKHHFERMLNLSNDLKLFVNKISDKVVQEYGDRLGLCLYTMVW